MKLSLKQLQVIRIVFIAIIAIIVSISVSHRNYIVPIITISISPFLLLYLQRQVKEVIVDERDYTSGGKSALLAIQIYIWFALFGIILLFAFRDLNPSYEPIAITLAYSICLLMILYSAIFFYFNKAVLTNKKIIFKIICIIIFIILVIISIRLFSGEDDWICQNGQWVKHGQPDFPAPAVECKK